MGFTFEIEGLRVFFPYDTIYPEQYKYMCELKRALDAKGQCVLEMPTGTGKTVTLFSLITSYQFARPQVGKLIYCTRTVQEMSKALEELRTVIDFRVRTLKEETCRRGGPSQASVDPQTGSAAPEDKAAMREASRAEGHILGIGLSTRRVMCVHPEAQLKRSEASNVTREDVDEMCRQLTAPWNREDANKARNGQQKLCQFYEKYSRTLGDQSRFLETGIYTVEDLRAMGQQEEEYGWCPYYVSKRLIQAADVVVLNYKYVLDPKVSMATSLGGPPLLTVGRPGGGQQQMEAAGKEPSIVVFDEAHNIDDVCIESLSVPLNREHLELSARNLQQLNSEIDRVKKEDNARLQEEYRRLVQGLQQAGQIDEHLAERLQSPVLPEDLANEAIPGNIRRAEHFVGLLRRVVNFLQRYLEVDRAQCEGPLSILHKFEEDVEVDSKSLKFCHERLRSLLNTLRVANLDKYYPITRVADFVTLLGTYAQGFTVITDPYPEAVGKYDPTVVLSCLDASLAIRPVLQRYQSVVLTSGTISPLEMYPKILGMTNVVTTRSFSITMERKCLCPLIVTHGPDQVPITSRFALREDPGVLRNYGELLEQMVQAVPDGIVCFFPSFRYMEQVVDKWCETGVLGRVSKHKLVFLETKDHGNTEIALSLYRKACDNGQGAVLISVARGKVAEGIDFDRHYGRCVIVFGVPFQYALSRDLRARLEFLKEHYSIQESEFLNFDAMRQTSQCLGRVIRSKRDYGVMVLADQRYARQDKRSKIPDWIQKFLEPGHVVMSTDVAVLAARSFLLSMSQPYEEKMGENASVWTPKDLAERQRREQLQPPVPHEEMASSRPPPEKRQRFYAPEASKPGSRRRSQQDQQQPHLDVNGMDLGDVAWGT
uniref:DNA 5'-3' helicase n=1 Tax=Crypthecodinium cohnii TaxID=2866 RepID=A0A516AGU7_CRYCO|nr:general transcription and DNA repair factor IIH helicase subunit XPD [Crypthecodinium cohnii]USW07864.1 general transcription and DNA repair factor IIH helicase subunit XPD [Crypthecodinium cohnii]USW07865.1 general transcritpion and DNA repair factor IIH helicase subunit XPD [Crypthecodinium cohnii]